MSIKIVWVENYKKKFLFVICEFFLGNKILKIINLTRLI